MQRGCLAVAFLLTWAPASSLITQIPARYQPASGRRSRSGTVVSEEAAEEKHIVLVGGGHAHVQVIRALNAAARPRSVRVSLIEPQLSASYSGMVPGCVAGLYEAEQVKIQLEPLARWASIDFLPTRVLDLDPAAREVHCADGTTLRYDALSLDIGSCSRGAQTVPGVAEHAISTRPISALLARVEEAERGFSEDGAVRAVVVGGGAAGIELAMALWARWDRVLGGGQRLSVTLLDSGAELLSHEPPACRAAVREALRERGIEVEHGCVVRAVRADAVELAEGDPRREVPATHVLWATGAEAQSLAEVLARRGLATSERGWVRVRPTLQCVSHDDIFAAGDCAQIDGLPGGAASPPKAGVYAVRAGPVLIQNLLAAVGHGELVAFSPQSDFLKLLMCGDGTALGFRFGLAFKGPWVWRLKDLIDSGFMRLFAPEALPDLAAAAAASGGGGGAPDAAQFDKAFARLERPAPADAAALLARDDDGVSHVAAFGVLKDMADDDEYKAAVLALLGGESA